MATSLGSMKLLLCVPSKCKTTRKRPSPKLPTKGRQKEWRLAGPIANAQYCKEIPLFQTLREGSVALMPWSFACDDTDSVSNARRIYFDSESLIVWFVILARSRSLEYWGSNAESRQKKLWRSDEMANTSGLLCVRTVQDDPRKRTCSCRGQYTVDVVNNRACHLRNV